jgi:hypothetical protein
MPRGRPVKTEIREKIATILNQKGISYGYQIYKIYREVFGKISLRNLYYNLKKGIDMGEFIIIDIKRENGAFTWGNEAEHKYYTLGPYAKLHKLTDIQKIKLERFGRENFEANWEEEIRKQIEKLEDEIKQFNTDKLKMRYEDKRKMENLLKGRIELLKDWLKAKIGRHQILRARINKLYELFDTHTP